MNKKSIAIVISVVIIVIICAAVFYKFFLQKEPTTVVNENTESKIETTSNTIKKFSSVTDAIDKSTEVINSADYAKAKVFVESALTEYPNSGFLHILYGTVLDILGDKAKALSEADKAIQVEPQNYLTWRYKIMMIRNTLAGKKPSDQEYKTKIIDLYTKALNATHNNIELITPYAIFLEQAGDIQAAITQWNLAIEVNPLAKSSYEREIDRLNKIK